MRYDYIRSLLFIHACNLLGGARSMRYIWSEQIDVQTSLSMASPRAVIAEENDENVVQLWASRVNDYSSQYDVQK